ncbi:hypothetical protein Tco_0360972 [Tanacetum coccineum]
MDRQCTQPKRPRNAAWFKDQAMLAKALESGQILDEEQLAFLADPGIPDGQAAQTIDLFLTIRCILLKISCGLSHQEALRFAFVI